LRSFVSHFQIKIAAIAFGLLLPAAASAGWTAPEAGKGGASAVVTADPDLIVAYLQAHGYKAELQIGKDEGAIIKTASGGHNWALLFYGCSQHKNCGSVQFHAGFELQKKADLKAMNDFNREKRFAKAYLDKDDDANIDMDVEMAGGMPEKLFKENIGDWETLMAAFVTHIGY